MYPSPPIHVAGPCTREAGLSIPEARVRGHSFPCCRALPTASIRHRWNPDRVRQRLTVGSKVLPGLMFGIPWGNRACALTSLPAPIWGI